MNAARLMEDTLRLNELETLAKVTEKIDKIPMRDGPKKSDSRISEVSALIDGASRMKRSKTDETTPPQSLGELQSEGGAGSAQGRTGAGAVGPAALT